MAQVGLVGCTFVKFRDAVLKERNETWTQAGFDTIGAQLLGLGDSEVSAACVLYDTEAKVETWHDEMAAMQGFEVLVLDDWGQTHEVYIKRMGNYIKRPLANPAGQVRGELQLQGTKVT